MQIFIAFYYRFFTLNKFNVPYTLVKADVEYFGKNNYGNILLELKGAKEINESAFQFFRKNKIKNKIKGYV